MPLSPDEDFARPRPALPWGHVHFVGVGGVGMAGLAHILADWGCRVTGSDRATSSMTASLRGRGLDIRVGHRAARVRNADAVVCSSAIPAENPERRAAADLGIPLWSRGAFLARIAECFDTVVAVAGSHGKTTTTTMIAHIMRTVGRHPGFLIGGTVPGWERAADSGDGALLITEVDESDGTQALMQSTVAVITTIDDDHAWSHGGTTALHHNFARFAARATQVIAGDDEQTREVLRDCNRLQLVGAERQGPIERVLPVPGRHNLMNATLAVAACECLGVDEEAACRALQSYPGVERRLSRRYRGLRGRLLVIEDYAHHPVELSATLSALREAWPEHRLTILFQPHRFERVRHYGTDFAAVLSAADEVHVIRPFAAWVEDGDIADPRLIARQVSDCPCDYWEDDLAHKAEHLAETLDASRRHLVAIVGAGDVNALIRPLVNTAMDGDRKILVRKLKQLGIKVDASRSWADLTSLSVGSGKPLRVLPEQVEELADVLRLARMEDVPAAVMGAGSDLVGTDREPLRLVLSLTGGAFGAVEIGGREATVGAAVCLYPLARGLAEAGCCPRAMAELAWIPGSLGGALRLNAGAGGHAIGELAAWVEGLHLDGRPWRADGDRIEWIYRDSSIPADVVITRAGIRLPDPDKSCSLREIEARGNDRQQRQPAGRSAGCVFRNPPGTSAGKLLDDAGCKGMRRGALVVSATHANFILNEAAAAPEEDMRQLVAQCRNKVRQTFGVTLREEIRWAADTNL